MEGQSCTWDATGSYVCSTTAVRPPAGPPAAPSRVAAAATELFASGGDCTQYGCPVGAACSWSSDCANGLSCAGGACTRVDPFARRGRGRDGDGDPPPRDDPPGDRGRDVEDRYRRAEDDRARDDREVGRGGSSSSHGAKHAADGGNASSASKACKKKCVNLCDSVCDR